VGSAPGGRGVGCLSAGLVWARAARGLVREGERWPRAQPAKVSGAADVWRVFRARDIETAIVLRRSVVWRVCQRPARGTALANDCVPYCAKGRFHRLPVSVKVYSRKYCGNIERYVYTRLRYRIRGRLPRWLGRRTGAAPFPCRMYDF
jgi:hypothetical protein